MGKRPGSSTRASATRKRSAEKASPRAIAPEQPLLDAAGFHSIISEMANQIAPGDVATLLEGEKQLRARAARLPAGQFPHLADQLGLALDCLRDHHDGECPQIPYFTISVLAAAVYYFNDELDVIPDFLPRIGRLDDAIVMALACEVARAGLQRYCDWKGRDLDAVLPKQ